MKIDTTVRQETGYIALWVLIFSLIMESVFLIAGAWDLSVLLGNLLGGVVAISNFFLMGLTVQKAVGKEEKQAAHLMRLSQQLRLGLLFITAVLGVALNCFHFIAVLVPLFFPRIAIAVRPLFDKKKGSERT